MQKKSIQKDQQEIEEQYQELELQNQDEPDQVENLLLVQNTVQGTKFFVCTTPVKIIISILVVIIILILSIVNMQVDNLQEGKWANIKNQIITKDGDQANYELLTLKKNKLKILLITQKDIKLSGASLDVLVGSQQNPTEFQGLAHLLEHMLFMGSEKYPQEDEFNNIISKSSGSSNAYTAEGNTNYHFQGTHNNLIEILNIWSRFFIDPLLLEDQLQREVQAVDSEYFNTLTREEFRDFNLIIALSEDNHPFKLFYCGNTDSLLNTPKQKGLSTYEALRSFKKQYYYSENMVLAIKSDESQRDNLKEQLEGIFQDIPTKYENLLNFTQKDSELIRYCYNSTKKPPISDAIKSVSIEKNKIKKLQLIFVLEDDQNFEYLSLQFVRDLFNFGFQETNFCFFVEDRKLATQCQVEIDQFQSNLNQFLMFSVNLQFLDSENTIEEIVKAYFYFMNAVANYPKKQKTYDAIKSIQERLFDIIDDENQRDVMSEVIQYSKFMNQNRLKDILAQNNLYKKYNETNFSKIMSVLTDPGKIIIIHKTNNSTYVEGQKIIRDQLNDLNYTQSKISLEEQKKFRQHKSLNISKIQPLESFGLIPDKLLKNTELCDDDAQPKLIHVTNKGKIFAKKDVFTFKKPIQKIILKFQSEVFIKDISSRAVNEMLANYLSDEIQRKAHLLQFQKLKIEVEPTKQEGGILIKITCLSSQVKKIFAKIQEVLNLKNSQIISDQSFFSEQKQKLIDKLNSYNNQVLYLQYLDLLNSFIKANQYSKAQILEVVGGLQQNYANEIIQQFGQGFNLVIYVFGDIDKSQIINQFDLLTKNTLIQEQPFVYQTQYLNFKNNPITLQLLYQSGDHNNNLCSNFYQLGKLDLIEYSILKLIEKPLKSKAFDYLRTQLQLGYVVASRVIKTQDYFSVIIIVQGSKHTPNQYDQHIEEFLPDFEQYLSSLTKEEISSMQQSLIQSLRIDQFDKFTDKAEYFWTFIDDMTYDFELNQKAANFLSEKAFTNKELQIFFSKYFKNSNSRFSIQLFSPSKVKQSDLPIKLNTQSVYSGDVGKYITSREDFEKLQLDHLTFQDQQRLF
ncbi:hypothetical protein ABPG72_006768 [Tetrahymena utriculariae]